MTDYDDREQSQEEGQPVELYQWIGSYRSYFMTTDALPHTLSGSVYLPVSGLKRSTIKAGTHEEDNADLTISVPISHQIVKDYAFQTTPPRLRLIIHRFHRSSAIVVRYWNGPVSSIVVEGEYARFRSPSKFGIVLQGNIPSVYIQPPCNHVLFDARCKVSRVANTQDTSVTSVTGRVIVIDSIGAFAAGWFKGGEIVMPSRNERRMIEDQGGTGSRTLTVNYAFGRLNPGEGVQVTAGCDHSFSGEGGCPKFANQINFGGHPFVPGETNNPFEKGVN